MGPGRSGPHPVRLRILIVDDEALARSRVRQMLGEEPDVEVLGECANGPDAIRFIREQRPDLVFLDVQMPEVTGFDVLRALTPELLPAVIFVTAHDHHAIEAFEVQAVDYLLKPFKHARFAEALHRAREHLQAREVRTLNRHLTGLLHADIACAVHSPRMGRQCFSRAMKRPRLRVSPGL
jgi:two-component system, LytTR family, response regulator